MCEACRRADEQSRAGTMYTLNIGSAIEDANKAILDEVRRQILGAYSMPSFNLGTTKSPGGTTAPMMSSDKQQVIKDIKRLHEEGQDIEAISDEIKAIKAKAKERIINGLKAVADLEQLKAQNDAARRFVLAYWTSDNEARVVRGVDFAYNKAFKESEEGNEMRVFIVGGRYDIRYEHLTMKHLRSYLEEGEILHHIAYLD